MTKQEVMFPLIEEYEQSSQTILAFCAEKGLRKSRFLYWRRKYRESQSASEGFIPIPVPGSAGKAAIRLSYPNGISIELPAADLSFIAQLIHLV